MPNSRVSQAEQVRDSILRESESRQQQIARNLLEFDSEHRWVEGSWSDADEDGEIEYSALSFDDESVLAAFVLKRVASSGSVEIGSCLATYRPEESEQARSDLVSFMPPMFVLEVWADQMKQSA